MKEETLPIVQDDPIMKPDEGVADDAATEASVEDKVEDAEAAAEKASYNCCGMWPQA